MTGGALDLDAPALVASNGRIHSAVLEVLQEVRGRQAVTPSTSRRSAIVAAVELRCPRGQVFPEIRSPEAVSIELPEFVRMYPVCPLSES